MVADATVIILYHTLAKCQERGEKNAYFSRLYARREDCARACALSSSAIARRLSATSISPYLSQREERDRNLSSDAFLERIFSASTRLAATGARLSASCDRSIFPRQRTATRSTGSQPNPSIREPSRRWWRSSHSAIRSNTAEISGRESSKIIER